MSKLSNPLGLTLSTYQEEQSSSTLYPPNTMTLLFTGDHINPLGDSYGVEIMNGRGATEYDLRFYDLTGDAPKRLKKLNGDYSFDNVYEDCEIGSVTVRFADDQVFTIDFGHDGNEPFTARLVSKSDCVAVTC